MSSPFISNPFKDDINEQAAKIIFEKFDSIEKEIDILKNECKEYTKGIDEITLLKQENKLLKYKIKCFNDLYKVIQKFVECEHCVYLPDLKIE